jgi:hypothetical protein
VIGKPARYRLQLAYPDGREEIGGFRRYRPGGPQLGHAFTTLEDGHPISWTIDDEELAHDEQGEPYLALTAHRDFDEVEELPDHELEHALAQRDRGLDAALGAVDRAASEGLSIELVALEPGEESDWEEAGRYIDSLVFEEIDDDLFEQCGVDVDNEPRETWLDTVKERLREDLERFRGDVEDDHDEIEEWDFRDGAIFAAVGADEDEANPDSAYGWMIRLVDAGALGAAGLSRVRKAELTVS